jgi:PKD repeat protein
MLFPRVHYVLLIVAIGFSTITSAQTFVYQTTTTLSQENANNTSAADSFAGQSNGNAAAAGSTSKLPLRSLLYDGSTTKIYAHFMPWFGQSNHMSVGYNSNDSGQVKKQVDDMQSRGIDGVVVDWYGPNKLVEEATTQLIKAEAESRSGFEFAVMEDAGALSKCAATTGCSVTQQVIDDLTYAYNNYLQSPAYLLLDGRPAVFFFGVDAYTIDWNAVRAQVQGNPAFIFRNNGGFTHAQSDGSFSWINVNASNPDDEGLAYLDSFYTTAQNYPTKYTFGSVYPGFDNSLAPWRPTPKKMKQHCGQTWVDSFARIGLHYSSTDQLEAMQLVTWNDYEEATEIESGIENCVTVSAGITGASLTWSITGQENTVHHYTAYISQDGSNLMSLGDTQTASGSYSRDLSALGLDPSKTYTLYVEAVGKPSLKNHFSNAVSFAPANQPPKAVVTVSPASGTAPVTVTASTASSTDADGKISSSSINFGDGSTAVTGTSANHTYSSTGTYTVTATLTDNLGASSQATAKVTVSASTSTCTISKINRTITICSPIAGNSYKSPVRVTATATDSSAVSYMQIYVDGAKVYQKNQVKSIETNVSMGVGSHRLTVQAKDAAGTYFKTVNITVTP